MRCIFLLSLLFVSPAAFAEYGQDSLYQFDSHGDEVGYQDYDSNYWDKGPANVKKPLAHKSISCSQYLTYDDGKGLDENTEGETFADQHPVCAGKAYYALFSSNEDNADAKPAKCEAVSVKSIASTVLPDCQYKEGNFLGFWAGDYWDCSKTSTVTVETITLGSLKLGAGAYGIGSVDVRKEKNAYAPNGGIDNYDGYLYASLADCKKAANPPPPAPDDGSDDGGGSGDDGGGYSGGNQYNGPECTYNCSNGEPAGGSSGPICPIGSANPGGICG